MRTIGLGALMVGLVAATPRPSRACSTCPMSGVVEVPNLDALPGNSGWLVWNIDEPLPECEAYVDGVPAMLEVVPDVGPIETVLSSAVFSADVVRVTPPPPEGATVEVIDTDRGAWCFGQRDPGATQIFVAGPVDLDAPADIEGLYWDLHGFPTTTTTSCDFDFIGMIYLQGQLPVEDETQAPRLVDVEVTSQGTSVFHRRWRFTEAPLRLALPRADFHDLDLTSLCLRVTLVDLAGNRGAPSEWMCAPCHAVFDPETSPDAFPPEPRWSELDPIVGGYCNTTAPPPEPSDDSGGDEGNSGEPATSTGQPGDCTSAGPNADGSTTAAQDDADGTVDRGCACGAAPRRSRSAAWALVLLLVAPRRRARRVRRR